MKVLGLIPARGGSKGIIRKNVRLLCGKPLLAYTAETALAAKKITRLVLSTDDAEIAVVGRDFGLETPFLRPTDLAKDTTPTLPVVQHALTFLHETGEDFDAVCLLQPTNPLRRVEDIDRCIELLEATEKASSVISVLPVPSHFNPKWVYWRDSEGRLILATGDREPVARRQDLPPAFYRDGSIYVTRTKTILNQNSLYGSNVCGYAINPEFSANLDTEEDWVAVEKKMSEQLRLRSSAEGL